MCAPHSAPHSLPCLLCLVSPLIPFPSHISPPIQDEPTSGLDSFTALNIGKTLWALAHEEGRTVVATVHQPRAQLFNLLDSVLILSQGRTVYWGPGQEVVLRHFAAAGHACPPLTNPVRHARLRRL